MITYIEKGRGLHEEIVRQGFSLRNLDGVYYSNDDVAVQNIIDTYNPLSYARAQAKTLVKEISASKRLQYTTQVAGKETEYASKINEANTYLFNGDVGIYMQNRIDITGESASTIANIWQVKNAASTSNIAAIAALEDKLSLDIDNETDWTKCRGIAQLAISNIEAI